VPVATVARCWQIAARTALIEQMACRQRIAEIVSMAAMLVVMSVDRSLVFVRIGHDRGVNAVVSAAPCPPPGALVRARG
jgi:hypothetical protein